MSVLNILTIGNDIGTLADAALNLDKAEILSSKTQTLIEDMKDTCHAVGGLGLSANQVGAPANLFIYSTDLGRSIITNKYSVIINPVIVSKKNIMSSKGEGCLSIPDRYFNVKRYKKIRITGLDEYADPIDITTKSKKLARILQHEVDHLNGITIADKGKEV